MESVSCGGANIDISPDGNKTAHAPGRDFCRCHYRVWGIDLSIGHQPHVQRQRTNRFAVREVRPPPEGFEEIPSGDVDAFVPGGEGD